MEILSLGDIADSRLWLSIEKHPWYNYKFSIKFMRTYNGTKAGCVILFKSYSLVAHIR